MAGIETPAAIAATHARRLADALEEAAQVTGTVIDRIQRAEGAAERRSRPHEVDALTLLHGDFDEIHKMIVALRNQARIAHTRIEALA